jgi:D-arabinose 1-dehydrogenase-like Zn-dependent alcohol dehydrogenase
MTLAAVGQVEEQADDVQEGQLHVAVEYCGICSGRV